MKELASNSEDCRKCLSNNQDENGSERYREVSLIGSACLTALFLRGFAPAPVPASIWPTVRDAILSSGGSFNRATRELELRGHWHASSVLQADGLLSRAVALVSAGEVLTPFSLQYPSNWLKTLGHHAPPALWQSGELPVGTYSGVVGSRQLSTQQADATRLTASVLAEWGHILISGGAHGADSLASTSHHQYTGETRSVTLHPCGLRQAPGLSKTTCHLSLAPPDAPFSGRLAMERNQLIYAATGLTVVTACQLRRGGTWGGAVLALRKKLCRVGVIDWQNDATRALCHLGAVAISPDEIASGLLFARSKPIPLAQPSLFGSSTVRELTLPAYGF
ncbi:DNA-processing protein DprA [Kamptonema cortianum]|nr:DNA-processing protein DprA [Geitlerinema splendidum]MDK3161150.1 DNA-processing protein DprA [Kamptonema cortianum]